MAVVMTRDIEWVQQVSIRFCCLLKVKFNFKWLLKALSKKNYSDHIPDLNQLKVGSAWLGHLDPVMWQTDSYKMILGDELQQHTSLIVSGLDTKLVNCCFILGQNTTFTLHPMHPVVILLVTSMWQKLG